MCHHGDNTGHSVKLLERMGRWAAVQGGGGSKLSVAHPVTQARRFLVLQPLDTEDAAPSCFSAPLGLEGTPAHSFTPSATVRTRAPGAGPRPPPGANHKLTLDSQV